MRQIAKDAPLSMGTHRVMGLSSQGALSSYTVSYSSRFIEAEPLQLEIDPSGSDLLSRLGPMRPSFCYYSPTSFLTFGVPELWPVGRRDDDREAAHSEMLGILGYLGRAAVVLGRDGRVRYANGYAKRLLGGSLAPGVPLHPSREADRKALRNLVQRALEGGTAVDRLSLDRTVDSAPFLVRAICLDSSALGGEGVLLLLGNAFEKGDINKAGLLQLFGLSPAEAKLALLVGMGQPPREAAQQVNVTENTARSVLKTVFHKLGISRQAELVGIVTRLDMM
jgi:DNA-binding CsgD family transcriptional regulator